MGLGIDPEVLKAANQTLGEFIAQEPEFYNTAENCKALQQYLKNQQIPIEQWNHINIWAAAFWQCKKQGLLAPVPPPKSRAEREAEYEANDRRAGSSLGNQITEGNTEADNIRKIVEGARDLRNRLEEGTNKKIADAATIREMDENPHKYIPDFTVDQPAEVLKPLRSSVLKAWMKKRQQFLTKEAIERDERKQ